MYDFVCRDMFDLLSRKIQPTVESEAGIHGRNTDYIVQHELIRAEFHRRPPRPNHPQPFPPPLLAARR